ncbi:desert hedgehog protein-like [Pollicipes pollicipes]|uniref:desert hedgehog protein-like n=1 Tax=Pollicipes pollicipes TaxID=41117 RepID=UPI0018857AB8|nr:desert hedgehog protein-like [Pollicipes pollicipes]
MLSSLLMLALGCVLAGQVSSNEVKLADLLRELQRGREALPYQMNEYGDDYDGANPGEVIMARVRKGAGNCYAQGKCLYYSKRLKTEFCGDCGRRQGCFPGDATVMKETGDVINMADLRVDDRVLAASRAGQLTFSPVVSWLDKRSNHTAQYLRLTTESGHQITLSSNHVLLVKNGDQLVSRFAGDVQHGDLVKAADSLQEEQWSPVVASEPTISTGAFVPLTATGTIVVNGVLASCYASFDHDWAHALTTPLRWLPALFEDHSTRDAEGPRAAVESLKQFGQWLFPQPGSELRAAEDSSVVLLPLLAGPHVVSP